MTVWYEVLDRCRREFLALREAKEGPAKDVWDIGYQKGIDDALNVLAIIKSDRRPASMAREEALEEAAKVIEKKHTNNVGMVHPMAESDAAAIRSIKSEGTPPKEDCRHQWQFGPGWKRCTLCHHAIDISTPPKDRGEG